MKKLAIFVFLSLLTWSCKTTNRDISTTTSQLKDSRLNVNVRPYKIIPRMGDKLETASATSTSFFGITSEGPRDILINSINSEGYDSLTLSAIANAVENSNADSFNLTMAKTETSGFLFYKSKTVTVKGYPIYLKFQEMTQEDLAKVKPLEELAGKDSIQSELPQEDGVCTYAFVGGIVNIHTIGIACLPSIHKKNWKEINICEIPLFGGFLNMYSVGYTCKGISKIKL